MKVSEIRLLLLLLILLFVIVIVSTELLALCDGCLDWGWFGSQGSWLGCGYVGLAFGMFLLPGFGVSSSSPWVPGQPTSMCGLGIKLDLSNFFESWFQKVT